MLELDRICVAYGKRQVLREVTLAVGSGEIVALLGANAAGKTTTLRAIMGLKELGAGTISIEGRDMSRSSTIERVRAGITLSPEGRQIFGKFTVHENLLMGGYNRRDRDRMDTDFERMFAMFPRLAERRRQKAGSMSGGEQQMLAIARALMSQPRCLLLDEPTLGLAPIVVDEIAQAIRKLAGGGMAILIAEQDATMALSIADRAYVLEGGRMLLNGTAAALRENPEVQRIYLGA